ncbi:MAG: site-specific DNA-methyltransferase, partial [Spirochaetaceae bacterium]|nr:site-specific DNA-methyltransferase [Spirochaetaceae bacterium]
IDLIVSDIPYGIGVDDWDVLHDNTNNAYLGSSPAQEKAGAVFKKRGKPLNGWSEADRLIPKQYYDWVKTWVGEWFRVIKPGANVFVFSGRRMAHRCVCAFEDVGFTYKDMLGWEKERAAHRAQRISVIFERRKDMSSANKWAGWKVGNLRPVFEPILWFTKPYKIGGTIADNVLQYNLGAFNENILKKYGQEPDNIFHIQAQQSDVGLHPTQKPLKLMELLIELTTVEKQIVLDPFCGSATTLVAASRLDRQYIGFEKEEKYYNIALNRLNEEECDLFEREGVIHA